MARAVVRLGSIILALPLGACSVLSLAGGDIPCASDDALTARPNPMP